MALVGSRRSRKNTAAASKRVAEMEIFIPRPPRRR